MLPFDYINHLRLAELESVLPLLKPNAAILELGAGSGQQSLELQRLGFEVTALDLRSSTYSENRVFPVVEYDGIDFPFPDDRFDIVFSNVLEHVSDLEHLHAEIVRVLKPAGECVHILPTPEWRFWTTAAGIPSAFRHLVMARTGRQFYEAAKRWAAAILQRRHGERGNFVTELYFFHPRWWLRNFRQNGFDVVCDQPVGFFYTGEVVFGLAMKMPLRRRLSKVLGSSCRYYHLRIAAARPASACPPPT